MSCQEESKVGITELVFDKDLIPEGIAVDVKTQRVYLNSLKDKKIVSSNLDGTDAREVISSGAHGYQSGFGMTIKGDTLYALGNGLPMEDNTSILLLIDIKSNQLIKSYKLEDTIHVFLNDIAVSSNHDVYITDSKNNTIYTLNKETDQLEFFVDREDIPFSNGIAISDDDELLYLASWDGIIILDLATSEILNSASIESQGIDGLKYYKNSLIGIVNIWKKGDPKNGMYRYHLNDPGTQIIKRTKMIDFDHRFGIPTTFDLLYNHVCFIMDTQLDLFDGDNNVITQADSLQTYRLMIEEIENDQL